MAVTVARLEAILSADTGKFDRSMKASEGRMKRAGRAAGVMGGLLAGALVVGLKKSVDQAIEAEQSTVRLESAFKASKVPIDRHRQAIEKAGAAARNLGFDDEELNESLGSLIVATGDYKKAQDASNVAMDLARFKHIDLGAATKMLTQSFGGSQRAIKQLGLSVPPVTGAYDSLKAGMGKHIDANEKVALAAAKMIDKQSTAAQVIDMVREKTRGQAQAFADTAEGGMMRFKERTEELQEMIGAKLLPKLATVIELLIKMAGWLEKHPKLVKALVIALGGLAAALVTASVAQTALNLAVLANPYVAATVAIIALAAGVALLYAKVKELRPVLEFLAGTFLGLPLPLRILNTLTGGAARNFERLKSVLNEVKDLVQWLIDNAKKLGGVLGKVGSVAGAINPFGDADPAQFKKAAMGFMGGTGPGNVSRALYDELQGARNMGLTLTSGYRPGAVTKHGTPSDHGVFPSKAIDVAGAPAQMARFFSWLIGQRDVKQAFYDPLGSIFGGMLSSYREGGHSDHVHVATYDKGGYLRPGWNLAYNGLGRPEPVGAGTVNIYLPNYVGSKSELTSWLQNAARQFRRQNGRSMF